MTMMMTNSQFGLEDMEALLWGPPSPMADIMDTLSFRPDQEILLQGGGTSLDGDISPVSPLTTSSLSSSSSPPPFYSPPPSPTAVLRQGDKTGTECDLLSLPWLGQTISGDSKEEMFVDRDWMAEKVDLNEFDLETLIGSCDPTEESHCSHDDLIASLDCSMEIDSLPVSPLSTLVSSLPSAPPPGVPSSTVTPIPSLLSEPSINAVEEPESCTDEQDVPSPPMCIPEPQEELEIKSEPSSPDLSCPLVDSPSTPASTLDLGSEVDVSESEVKPVVASVAPQVQRLVVSLSPTRIILVLAPREEVAITSTTVTTSEAAHSSPLTRSSRSRPYPKPTFKVSPACPSINVTSFQAAGGDERPATKTTKVKKLKKMEQNKTAATRYRQKKKSEMGALLEEYAVLDRKNMELNEKAESITREIEYLKELMEEVRQARTKRGVSADP